MKVKKPKSEADQNGEQPKKKFKMSRELESLLAFNAVLEFSPKESVSNKKNRKSRRSLVSSDELDLLNSLNIKRKKVSRSMITRPTDVGADRIIVFVDPMDEEADFWPPAMVIPTMEWDSDVDGVKPGQCLVKFFEDNETSKVLVRDLAVFDEQKEPFLTFKKNCKTFFENSGVKAAVEYLRTGKTPDGFRWSKWGQNIVNTKKATNIQPRKQNVTNETESDQDSESDSDYHYESEREEREHDHDRDDDEDEEDEDDHDDNENVEEEEDDHDDNDDNEDEEDEDHVEKSKQGKEKQKRERLIRRKEHKRKEKLLAREKEKQYIIKREKREDETDSDKSEISSVIVDPEEALKDIKGLTRDEFSDKLFEYMEKRGHTIYRNPILGYEPLDLKKLYEIVVTRGGMNEVSKNLQWRQVYAQMGIQNMSTSAAYSIRSNYEKYLYEFEKEHFRPGKVKGENIFGDSSPKPENFEIKEEPKDDKEDYHDIKETRDSKDSKSMNGKISTPIDERRQSKTPEPVKQESGKFQVGDMVKVRLKKYKEPYTAKILEYSSIEEQEKNAKSKGIKFTEPKYFVHYHGWKSHYDEWVPESALSDISSKGRKVTTPQSNHVNSCQSLHNSQNNEFSPIKPSSLGRRQRILDNGELSPRLEKSHSDTDVSKKKRKNDSHREKSPLAEALSKKIRSSRRSLTACDVSSDDESSISECIHQDDFVKKEKSAEFQRDSSCTPVPTPTPDPDPEMEAKPTILLQINTTQFRIQTPTPTSESVEEKKIVRKESVPEKTVIEFSQTTPISCEYQDTNGQLNESNEVVSSDESKLRLAQRKTKRLTRRSDDKFDLEKTPKEDSPLPSNSNSQLNSPANRATLRQDKVREEVQAIKEKLSCSKIDLNNIFPGFEDMPFEEKVKNITTRMDQLRSNYKQTLDRLVK